MRPIVAVGLYLKAVDAAYGYNGATTDAARVAFLFERHQQFIAAQPAPKTKARRKP